MKKIFAIFLLLIYTGSAFGIAVDYHFCNGQLTDVSLLHFSDHTGCKCNPSDMPKGCCKDKMVFLKGNDHKSSSIVYPTSTPGFTIDVPLSDNTLLSKEFFVAPNPSFEYVKQKFSPPLFLLNSVFRI